MTQLDRIEQKLDHLLRLVEAIAVKQDQNVSEGFADGAVEGTKSSKLPPRELRKWPEINFRGPKTPSRTK